MRSRQARMADIFQAQLQYAPARVNDVEQLLCVELLACCEDDQLKELCAAL